jgi:phosphoenolpyruvate carboxykinase (GTP)
MLIPPDSHAGWKIWTVGDDIAWLHLDETGQLRAINPEAGYFGVVPGTNAQTNRNAYDMIRHDTIFTNVAVTADNEPWWEDKDDGEPALDWQGRPFNPGNGKAAHPNSRFTVSPSRTRPGRRAPKTRAACRSRRSSSAGVATRTRAAGLPGARLAHGVLVGAGMASETTAAATGKVGVVRRDPMAMKPFCGYNFADYWAHWLSLSERTERLPPRIFHVNWFRRDAEGNFMWPGFGENLRVLRWIIDRCAVGLELEEQFQLPVPVASKELNLAAHGFHWPLELATGTRSQSNPSSRNLRVYHCSPSGLNTAQRHISPL